MISYNNNISNNNYNDIQYILTLYISYHHTAKTREATATTTGTCWHLRGGRHWVLWVTLEIFNDYTIYHGYILEMWIFFDFYIWYTIDILYPTNSIIFHPNIHSQSYTCNLLVCWWLLMFICEGPLEVIATVDLIWDFMIFIVNL